MNNKISFAGLITTITEESGENRSYTRLFVREMALIIREGLLRDGTVNLSGFGIFKLRPVPQRNGRNVQTGAPLLIPAHRKVMFKPEKSLRELINKRYAHLRPQVIDDVPQAGNPAGDAPQREITGSFFSSVFTDEDEPKKEIQQEKTTVTKAAPQPVAVEGKKEEAKAGPVLPEHTKREPDSVPIHEVASVGSEQVGPEKRNRTGMYLSIVAILMVLVIIWQMQKSSVPDEEIAEKINPEKPIVKESQPSAKSETAINTTSKEAVAKIPKPPAPKITQKAPAQNTVVYERQKHHTAFGDNLWKLAYHHYHDGYLWPLILLENHKKINNPDFVKTGLNLVIPALTIKGKKLDKATLTKLAKGHMLAYAAFKSMGREEAVNHLYAANKYDAAYVRSMIGQIDQNDLLALHLK